jgi:hypothetical protein
VISVFEAQRNVFVAPNYWSLPLQVGDGIGAGAGQRHDVILAITRSSAAGFTCRWAGMLAMEFPRHLTGSVLSRRERACRDRQNNRDDERPALVISAKLLRPTR